MIFLVTAAIWFLATIGLALPTNQTLLEKRGHKDCKKGMMYCGSHLLRKKWKNKEIYKAMKHSKQEYPHVEYNYENTLFQCNDVIAHTDDLVWVAECNECHESGHKVSDICLSTLTINPMDLDGREPWAPPPRPTRTPLRIGGGNGSVE